MTHVIFSKIFAAGNSQLPKFPDTNPKLNLFTVRGNVADDQVLII